MLRPPAFTAKATTSSYLTVPPCPFGLCLRKVPADPRGCPLRARLCSLLCVPLKRGAALHAHIPICTEKKRSWRNTNLRNAFALALGLRYVPRRLAYASRPLRTFASLNAHLQVQAGARPATRNAAAAPCGARQSKSAACFLAKNERLLRRDMWRLPPADRLPGPHARVCRPVYRRDRNR